MNAPAMRYCAEHNRNYPGPVCPLSDSTGWAMRSVGCHWIHPKYPQAVVSTFVRGNPSLGQMKSGYGAWVNFSLVGEFETRELAQQAVEALLGD